MDTKVIQENAAVQKRRIRISSKRQITIPAAYYEALGLSGEVDCVCANGMLILIPVKREDPAFAEEILADLIRQGYSGERLLAEFTRINRRVRPAVEKLIEEADALAKAAASNYVDSTDDVFGTYDQTEA